MSQGQYITLTGPVHTFGVAGKIRRYSEVALPLWHAVHVFKPERFNHETGEGEQREIVRRQVKTLEDAVLDGEFTPTNWSVGLRDHQRNEVRIEEVNGQKTFTLVLDPSQSLPLLDGQLRHAAMQRLMDTCPELKNSVVTATILLDGCTKKDFLALNSGLPVSQNTMLGIKQAAGVAEPSESDAYLLAKLLSEKHEKSMLYKQIAFNDSGSGIPVSAVCQSKSFRFQSLVGLMEMAHEFGNENLDWLAQQHSKVWEVVKQKGMVLTCPGQVFNEPPNGKRFNVQFFLAFANLNIFRALADHRMEVMASDIEIAVAAAMKHLIDVRQDIISSVQGKRPYLGAVAKEMFKNTSFKKYNGVPTYLVKNFGTPCFGLDPVPRMERDKVLAY